VRYLWVVVIFSGTARFLPLRKPRRTSIAQSVWFMTNSIKHLTFGVLTGIFLSFSAATQANPATAALDPQTEEPPSFLDRYTDLAQDVLLKGLEKVGVGYRFGGVGMGANGLDCSGFVQTVFEEAIGIMLPRTAREQAKQGEEVARSELKPGDLVFFNTMRRAFSHVGIYLGDHYFLHAPSSGGSVRLEDMQNSYWKQRYNGARRILTD